ncbi:MAG TPA: hypothetical protein VES19_15705 [Candidatus Limnocylindrales bacterium]|nr:hypothetical protein [Candidatus Limnocylindrales bacterium]
MSAATRTIQGTPSTSRLAIAFGAVALAAGLALLLAFVQLGATKSSSAPAAGTAPVQHDHGWSGAPSISLEPAPGEFRLAPGNTQPVGVAVTGTTVTPIVNGSTGFVVNPRTSTGGPDRLRIAQ